LVSILAKGSPGAGDDRFNKLLGNRAPFTIATFRRVSLTFNHRSSQRRIVLKQTAPLDFDFRRRRKRRD
jgi:hypothetical protein